MLVTRTISVRLSHPSRLSQRLGSQCCSAQAASTQIKWMQQRVSIISGTAQSLPSYAPRCVTLRDVHRSPTRSSAALPKRDGQGLGRFRRVRDARHPQYRKPWPQHWRMDQAAALEPDPAQMTARSYVSPVNNASAPHALSCLLRCISTVPHK